MKLREVTMWAAAGMLASSVSVYLFTGGESHAESAPPLEAHAPPAAPKKKGPKKGLPSTLKSAGTLDVDGRLSHARLSQGSEGRAYLMLEVRGSESVAGQRPAVGMAVVLDSSGSMAGERLARAQEAARGVVERLQDGDVVSVISFDTQTHVVAAPTVLGPATRSGIMQAIATIAPAGDTCISCGVSEARRQLGKLGDMPQHMLVLSDGKANHGLRDAADLRKLASLCPPITTVGVGLDYDEDKLAAIAESSQGRHHFVENDATLRALFQAETESLVRTVATDARVELRLAEGVKLVKVHDRAFERRGALGVAVSLGALSRGETKTVLVELQVPTAVLGAMTVADVKLSFEDMITGQLSQTSGSLGVEIGTIAAAIDPIVQARLERSRTSSTLENVNTLLRTGQVEAARAALRQRDRELEDAEKKGASGKAKEDLGEQRRSTWRAQREIAPPSPKPMPGAVGVCGCSPSDLMCSMRCSQKKNGDDALDMKR